MIGLFCDWALRQREKNGGGSEARVRQRRGRAVKNTTCSRTGSEKVFVSKKKKIQLKVEITEALCFRTAEEGVILKSAAQE